MTRPRRRTDATPITTTVDGRTFTSAEYGLLLTAYLADHGGADAQPRAGHRGGARHVLPPGWTAAYLHLLDHRTIEERRGCD